MRLRASEGLGNLTQETTKEMTQTTNTAVGGLNDVDQFDSVTGLQHKESLKCPMFLLTDKDQEHCCSGHLALPLESSPENH